MELNRIHNCTAIGLLTSLDEKAALVIADPPYGISYRSSYKEGMPNGNNREQYKPNRHEIREFDDSEIDPSWLKPAFDSLADDGAMYLFTRWDVLHTWKAAAEDAGFKVVQRIVWNKDMMSMGDLRYYGSMTEDILFCVKDIHLLRWPQREGNIWRVPRGAMMAKDLPKGGGWRHPTQKPVDLFKRIIRYSSNARDLIVDPFTGSGAACVAAQQLHRRWIGSDIDSAFAVAAQAWIEKESPHTLPMF